MSIYLFKNVYTPYQDYTRCIAVSSLVVVLVTLKNRNFMIGRCCLKALRSVLSGYHEDGEHV